MRNLTGLLVLVLCASCASIRHIHLPVPELSPDRHVQLAFDFSDAGDMLFIQAGKPDLRFHLRIQQGMVDYLPGERPFEWRTLRDTGSAVFRYLELGGAKRLHQISNVNTAYELIYAFSMQEGSAPIAQYEQSRHFHRSNNLQVGIQQIKTVGYLSRTTQYRALTLGLQHFVGIRERRPMGGEMKLMEQPSQWIPVLGFSEGKEVQIWKSLYSYTYAGVCFPLIPDLWSWNRPYDYRLNRYNPFVFGSGIYWKL